MLDQLDKDLEMWSLYIYCIIDTCISVWDVTCIITWIIYLIIYMLDFVQKIFWKNIFFFCVLSLNYPMREFVGFCITRLNHFRYMTEQHVLATFIIASTKWNLSGDIIVCLSVCLFISVNTVVQVLLNIIIKWGICRFIYMYAYLCVF